MIVTIHQPEHLPWLGFFDKARRADLFVVLDHVPYRKNYFQNRNRIRSADGAAWVTVPVLIKGHFGQPINEVRINHEGSPRWREKYWTSIEQTYRGSTFWKDYEEPLRRMLEGGSDLLCELNMSLIEEMMRALKIDVPLVRSSGLGVTGSRSELLLNICQAVGANTYLSGISGKEYLDTELFRANDIAVEFHEFHHPVYPQRYEPFMPCMSAIDLLFNCGPASLDMIRGVGVKVLEEVFL